MALFSFDGNWSLKYHKQFKIPKGFIIFKVLENSLHRYKKQFEKLESRQLNGAELIKIEVKGDIFFKKRSLNQNSLMWSLYSIEANEMNAGLSGHKDQNVTADYLYEADIKNYAPTFGMKLKKEDLERFKRLYNRIEIVNEQDNILVLKVTLGTSHFNTREMTEWIERQFNRMAYMGLSLENADSISKYWLDWQNHLNDNEIIIHDEIMTKKEYKVLHPSCQATGEFIGHEGGEVAHIQAIGMGGNEELEKNYASNWLHVKTEIHRDIIHGQGWEEFLKQFPHLTYKVRTALKREYQPLPEQSESINSEAENEDNEDSMTGKYQNSNENAKLTGSATKLRGLAIHHESVIMFTFEEGTELDSDIVIATNPGDDESAIKYMQNLLEKGSPYVKFIVKCCKELGIDPEKVSEDLGLF